ncbi:hypothetical protein DPMN_126468, partial [Dreissena polymorpha]
MPRFLPMGSRPPYLPLDDESLNSDERVLLDQTFSEDIPAGYISGLEQEPESSCKCCARNQIYLRLPRINLAYFKNIQWQKRIDMILSVFCLLIMLVVSVGLGAYAVFKKEPGLLIDKSYRAFRIPQHEASMGWGAFQAAKRNMSNGYMSGDLPKKFQWLFGDHAPGNGANGKRVKRDSPGNQYISVAPRQSSPRWKMQVVFLAEDGENMFTRERLQQVHEVEKQIIAHKQFTEFCFKDLYHPVIQADPAIKAISGCAPLNSLMGYFYPSRDDNGNVYYDGLGENMDNIDSALKLAMTSTKFYYYVDDKVNSSYMKSRLIRTEVIFGAPLEGYSTAYLDKDKQTEKYKEFVVSYIDMFSKASSKEISVLYGGNEIFDYEVEMTFWRDVKLALYALLAIFLLMLVLTSGSLWLTFWGFLSVLLSAPLAIFFYHVVFSIQALGILNGAAAFVILGIGVDDVFVFINIFRQAEHIDNPRERTLYTLRTAGKATFFTSFTTAAAFAANIASMIPAVHDFGLFMSLIVANCWVTVMVIMPAALYTWQAVFKHWEDKLCRIMCCCLPKIACRGMSVPADMANFLDNSNHGNQAVRTREVNLEDEDDDVAMLTMENPRQYGETEVDDPLIQVDPDPLRLPDDLDPKMSGGLGSTLQAILYYYVAIPVIKGRWIILVITTLLLCVSLGLLTQLKASTKPPQFFRSDTNIQRLLDLKTKYSAMDTVQCNSCSAIYSLGMKEATDGKVAQNPTLPFFQPIPESSPLEMTTHRANTSLEMNTNPPPALPPVHATTKTTIHLPTTHNNPTTIPPISHQPSSKPPSISHHPITTTRPTVPVSTPNTNPNKPFRNPTTHRPNPPKSVPENYDVCKDVDCSHPKERPLLETGATVYVVLGVKNFQWSKSDVGHVLSEDMGEVQFDPAFSAAYDFTNPALLGHLAELCTLCWKIANNSDLVKNGSAQCLPTDYLPGILNTALYKAVSLVPACANLPKAAHIYGNQQPAHSMGGLTSSGTAALWISFAFESTTSKSQSYFEAHKEYLKWEAFLGDIKKGLAPNSPLKSMFQTSEFWPEVFMEIVAVDSAIYGVVLSMVICMIAVVIFTRHIVLLFIIFISITEMICLVVGLFYVLGWEVGGVEAISLSILVGSSVDYCVHLVEGYILAAEACPVKD